MSEQITVNKVSELTGYSCTCIRKACKNEQIQSSLDGKWLIQKSDVSRWVLTLKHKPRRRRVTVQSEVVRSPSDGIGIQRSFGMFGAVPQPAEMITDDPEMGKPSIAGISFGEIRLSTTEDDNAPLFCARDVMDALELSRNTKVSDFLGDLEPESVGVVQCATPGGFQELRFITLAGVFYCCSKCRANQKARELDRWARKKAEEVALGRVKTESTELARPDRRDQHPLRRLRGLPTPRVQLPDLTTRGLVHLVVSATVLSTPFTNEQIWGQLYTEFDVRYRMDLKRRSETAKRSRLDHLEAIEINGEQGIEHLYALACNMFPESNGIATRFA